MQRVDIYFERSDIVPKEVRLEIHRHPTFDLSFFVLFDFRKSFTKELELLHNVIVFLLVTLCLSEILVQLLSLFQKNYDMLLGIFNPEGWLEITFIDSTLRVGRDDKGNIFLVEKIDSNMYKSTSI